MKYFFIFLCVSSSLSGNSAGFQMAISTLLSVLVLFIPVFAGAFLNERQGDIEDLRMK